MSDLRTIESMLIRPEAPEGQVFEFALDPEYRGRNTITEEDVALHDLLVSEFEIPALRQLTLDRKAAGPALDEARQEFGNQGFLVKAAVLGAASSRAFFSKEDYVMAEAEVASAIYYSVEAKRSVERAIIWDNNDKPVVKPVRANFPDVVDPLHHKTGLDDFTNPETMYDILKSHLALRSRIVRVGYGAMVASMLRNAERELHGAATNIYGQIVVEDCLPRLAAGGASIDFGRGRGIREY